MIGISQHKSHKSISFLGFSSLVVSGPISFSVSLVTKRAKPAPFMRAFSRPAFKALYFSPFAPSRLGVIQDHVQLIRDDFKVFDAVVSFVLVFVVNNFPSLKRSTKMFFHNNAMLKPSTYINIPSATVDVSPCLIGRVIHSPKVDGVPKVLAFIRAEVMSAFRGSAFNENHFITALRASGNHARLFAFGSTLAGASTVIRIGTVNNASACCSTSMTKENDCFFHAVSIPQIKGKDNGLF